MRPFYDIPPEEHMMIELTEKTIEEFRSDNGGFTRALAVALQIHYPFRKDWTKRLVGKIITERQYRMALASRNSKSKKYKSKHQDELLKKKKAAIREKAKRCLKKKKKIVRYYTQEQLDAFP